MKKTPTLALHHVAAEIAILGAALQDMHAAQVAVNMLTVDDFFNTAHGQIFCAVQSLVAKPVTPDLVTVARELTRQDRLAAVGGALYLHDLVTQTPTAANIAHHCRIVKECGDKRRLLDALTRCVQKVRGDDTDVSTLLANVRQELSGVASATGPDLAMTALGELLQEPEEEADWLVDHRLPTAGLSGLMGKPKSGKSTVARCLGFAVARGQPWLGFATRQGPVFYLGLEEKRGEVRRHFAAMGATATDPISVFIAPSPEDGLDRLRQEAEKRRPALIIVDPLMKLIRVKDANEYAAVMAALEPLLSLARETAAHVLAVHHLGKMERGGGDAILGSTAIFAAVDTALLLKRSERYRTLSSIQRYGPDLEDIVITLDPETRLVSAGPTRREADEAQAKKGIQEYLMSQDEPVDEATIHEHVEARRMTKQRALRALVEAREVSRTGGGKRGDPYLYSVSGSLVPSNSGEPEKRNAEMTVSSEPGDAYSGSEENGAHHTPREPERESWELDTKASNGARE